MKAVTSSALFTILAVGAVAAELLEVGTLPGTRYDPLLERSHTLADDPRSGYPFLPRSDQPVAAVPISFADYPPAGPISIPRSVQLLGPIAGSQPLADDPRPISDYPEGPRSNPVSISRSVQLLGPIAGSQPLADDPRPISDYPEGPRSNPVSISRSVQLLGPIAGSEPLADDPIYVPRPKTIPIKVLRSFPSKPLADDPRPIADYIYVPSERSQPVKDDPLGSRDYRFQLRSQPRPRYLLLRRSKPISIPRSVQFLQRPQPLSDDPRTISEYHTIARSNPLPTAQPRAQGTVKLDEPLLLL